MRESAVKHICGLEVRRANNRLLALPIPTLVQRPSCCWDGAAAADRGHERRSQPGRPFPSSPPRQPAARYETHLDRTDTGYVGSAAGPDATFSAGVICLANPPAIGTPSRP